MAEMTPWFPGTVRPARDGVYELFGKLKQYAKYANGKWYLSQESVNVASAETRESGVQRYRLSDCWQWRGFTEPQEG